MTTVPPTAGSWVPTDADLRAYAVDEGVCVRPLVRRVVDRETGAAEVVALRCGSTREHVCPSCSAQARRLRVQQCAEGWHLTDDPIRRRGEEAEDHDFDGDHGDELDDPATEVGSRRVRSTRRRDDAPDLPRVPAEDRSVGRTFTGRDGREYRPSMFVTLTLPSYGRVDRETATPVDPDAYDYRRAARDALALSALVDRWVQNLRRCAGYRVQYFAVVEAQRRLAGHVHLAIRGAIPRALLKQVTRATYASLWWPPTDHVVYDEADRLPVWDPAARDGSGGYVHPITRSPLPTWDQALDDLDTDPDARPWHVARFGAQTDVKGIIAPSVEADRAVRYLTKYLTKTIAHTHTPVDPDTGRPVETDARRTAHVDRLAEELRYTPCSPRCANWLRYGVQPQDVGPGLIPGRCPGAAHDRENAGLGGRRVLVSRHWSGKTLAEHAGDRAAVVRQVLAAAGIDAPHTDRMATDVLDDDGEPRYRWEPVEPGETDYRAAVLHLARERRRWRAEYDHARRLLEATSPPGAPAPPGCGRPFGNPPDHLPTDTPTDHPHDHREQETAA
jgi:hypothetical protein